MVEGTHSEMTRPMGTYPNGVLYYDGATYWLSLSGASGRNPLTDEIASDLGSQVTQTLNNLEAVLNEVGMNPGDILSLNVYLKAGLDPGGALEDYATLNEVYGTWFERKGVVQLPARTVLWALRFPPTDANVEISGVAVLSSYGERKIAEKYQTIKWGEHLSIVRS